MLRHQVRELRQQRDRARHEATIAKADLAKAHKALVCAENLRIDAKAKVAKLTRPTRRTFAAVAATVARYYDLPLDAVLGKSRRADHMRARKMASYLATTFAGLSAPAVAASTQASSSTVLSQRDAVRNAIAEDPHGGLAVDAATIIRSIGA